MHRMQRWNSKIHQDLLRKRKVIRYEAVGAPKDPFKAAVAKSSKLSKTELVKEGLQMTPQDNDGKSVFSANQPNPASSTEKRPCDESFDECSSPTFTCSDRKRQKRKKDRRHRRNDCYGNISRLHDSHRSLQNLYIELLTYMQYGKLLVKYNILTSVLWHHSWANGSL